MHHFNGSLAYDFKIAYFWTKKKKKFENQFRNIYPEFLLKKIKWIRILPFSDNKLNKILI